LRESSTRGVKKKTLFERSHVKAFLHHGNDGIRSSRPWGGGDRHEKIKINSRKLSAGERGNAGDMSQTVGCLALVEKRKGEGMD